MKNSKTPYKTKFMLLLAGTFIFMLLAYNMALKKTWIEYSKYNDLAKQSEESLQADANYLQLKAELAKIDRQLATNATNSADTLFQYKLLSFISSYCKDNKLLLKEVPQKTLSIENDISIETNQFKVEGSFKKLLQCIYQIEHEYKLGRVVSTLFQIEKKNSDANKEALTAIILIQNYRQLSHEK